MSAAPTIEALPGRLITRTVLDEAFRLSMAWKHAIDGDLLQAIVWHCIDLANTEHLLASQGLFDAYLDDGFPDDQRRPIPVRALGNSLDLDTETIRRCVKRLVASGLAEARAEGVITPARSYGLGGIPEASHASLDILSSLFRRFEHYGIRFPGSTLAERPWEADTPRARAAGQLFVLLFREFHSRYFVENIRLFGRNVTSGIVFHCIFRENNRPFVEDDALALKYAGMDSPPPAELRRPVSVRTVASRTGNPVETTRRHANRLIELGLVEAWSGGLVIPTAVVQREDFTKVIQNIGGSLFLMVRKMDRLAAAVAATA